ncbi:GGDEF domain-containing protein [Actinoplanes sp. NPDC051851]|uniref:GGDEF domain-containing protein n=1 Tax=Actinoplanes sp. NPDC051851 TaxID=3154753 RepID=UPI0034182501
MERGWRYWLGLVAVCALLRGVLPHLSGPEWANNTVYLTVSLGVPVAVLAGVLGNRPARRGAWILILIGQIAYGVADALTTLPGGEFAEPSLPDAFYLTSYVLIIAAMMVFIRRRTPDWDFASGVDALIVTISAALLTWVYLLQPAITDSTLTLPAKLTEVAYPLLDLMQLILAVRLVLGAGSRSPVLYLLFGSLGLMFAADTGYAVMGVMGWADETTGPYLGMLWIASLGLLGACALHPAMRDFDERSRVPAPEATPKRLIILTLAVLMVPGLQLAEHLRGRDMSVPLATSTCAIMFLLVLARMAGMVAAQRRAALTDGLTGVRNRRHFEHALLTECRRATRAGYGIGLLMIDIDFFKRVNDTYGHQAGDRVLREVAQRLAAGCRTGTVLARYGGEEFVALVPHIGTGELLAVAERIRTTISDLPIETGDQTLLTVTASVGAAAARAGHADPQLLLHAADEALYAAKAGGRNRSVVAPTLHTPTTASP